MKRLCTFIVLIALALLAVPRSSRADSFDVSLNTSSLSGTQVLVFELTDGDGVIDNSVSLTNFSLGGGSVAAPADYLGTTGVSGDILSGISMDDSSLAIAIFTQEFDPGSSLSFLLDTTNNFAGGTPDGFVMAVCDTSFNCYSDDPSGADLILGLNGVALTPASFTTIGASAQGLPAPVVTTPSGSTTTPEPSGVLLLGVGLLSLAVLQRKRRSSSALAG